MELRVGDTVVIDTHIGLYHFLLFIIYSRKEQSAVRNSHKLALSSCTGQSHYTAPHYKLTNIELLSSPVHFTSSRASHHILWHLPPRLGPSPLHPSALTDHCTTSLLSNSTILLILLISSSSNYYCYYTFLPPLSLLYPTCLLALCAPLLAAALFPH